jgi:hypothetical protein
MGKPLQKYADGPWSYPIDTSLEAADTVEPVAKLLREKVLRAVTQAGPNGITVLELCERDQLDRLGIQPRFSELRKAGKIADSGVRRCNPSGVRAICWVLPEFVSSPYQAPQR